MTRLRLWLRDKWRGYTDADLASLNEKLLSQGKPGGVIPLTRAETKALEDWNSWN